MFPYSMHSPDNQEICYVEHWCGSALSIGGVMWGSGGRKGLVGRMDDARIWNVTKDADYFEAVDMITGPRITSAKGMIGSDLVELVFSEEIYGTADAEGALTSGALSVTDLDDGRTVVSVSHEPGESVAVVTLSAPLDAMEDLGTDMIAPAIGGMYDEHGNAAWADAVPIVTSGVCPEGATSFQLNEAPGSLIVLDSEQLLPGEVNDPGETLLGDGFFHGDGVDNYILFPYNPDCLHASEALTLEVRIKPAVVDDGDGSTVQRIFAADDSQGYQMSVWRSESETWTPTFSPPDGVASIAFWMAPVDKHDGSWWKPVLTDYDACPIVADHWYQIRLVWNSAKVGGFPADIFIDDQGTAGDDVGQSWVGMVNCTDSEQTLLPEDKKLFEGDAMTPGMGSISIGVNVNKQEKNLFSGLIDWVTWSPVVDYSGLDEGPIPAQ